MNAVAAAKKNPSKLRTDSQGALPLNSGISGSVNFSLPGGIISVFELIAAKLQDA
jgi:hypothetical protein